MKRKWVLLILLLSLCALLTGCWSRRELNDLAIVVGMGIDAADGGRYEVSVQIVDPGEITKSNSGSGRAPVTVYSSDGKTLAEAIRRLTTITPRKSYFSHLRILIISEELAKQGIGETLDYMSRNQEFRTDFYISISREVPAKQMLSLMTPLEKIPATKMLNTLEVAEREWSPVVTVTLDELIRNMRHEGKHPVLTGFRIKGDPEAGAIKENVETITPAANIQAWGLAVFRHDKLVGWLNEEESKGYTDLVDQLNRTIVEVGCPKGGRLAVEITRSKTKLEGSVRNGEPEAKVFVRAEGNVADVQCQIDLIQTGTIVKIEKEVEKMLQKHMEVSLAKAQTMQTDIFGLGEAIHRADPDYWKQAKTDWNRLFADLSVQIEVDVSIRLVGTITESHLGRSKEK